MNLNVVRSKNLRYQVFKLHSTCWLWIMTMCAAWWIIISKLELYNIWKSNKIKQNDFRIRYYLGKFENTDVEIVQNKNMTSENFQDVFESNDTIQHEYINVFKQLLKTYGFQNKYLYLTPGDICTKQHMYALSRSRSRDDDKISILRSLQKDRHWKLYYNRPNDIPFEQKTNKLFWRGTTTGDPYRPGNRFTCVTKWWNNHPNIDVGFSFIAQDRHDYMSFVKGNEPISTFLRNKYILSLEGNDKDSGLNWKLNSNSLVFMPKPTCVTWLMEDQLIPNYHYILIKPDFSNLLERFEWCEAHPETCLGMIRNANDFMQKFKDEHIEDCIEQQVLTTYIKNVNTVPSTNTMYIDVLCMTRNNSKYIQYLNDLVIKIKHKYPNYDLMFYFFENDSKDDTVEQINKFLDRHQGTLFSETPQETTFKKFEKSDKRLVYMSNLRDTFKDKIGPLQSEYVFILDTDLIFYEDTMHKMISRIQNDDTIGMVTPFTETLREDNKHTGHYFDTLALIINNERNWPMCPFHTCSSCKRTLGHIKRQDVVEVDSAFGGLCLMYTYYFNQCKYTVSHGDACEHDSLNKHYKQVSNKKIVIDTKVHLYMQV